MIRQQERGFTIVELLIVIVVIAILAAVTIVAFNGVQGRAQFSKEQHDFATIKKLLELYKTDHGHYPQSSACANIDSNYSSASGWCGWNQGDGDSFIPGIVPDYASTIPHLSTDLPAADSYLYKSSDSANGALDDGTKYYQLIRYRSDGLHPYEMSDNDLLWTGDGYDGIAWGVKSNPSQPNW